MGQGVLPTCMYVDDIHAWHTQKSENISSSGSGLRMDFRYQGNAGEWT